MIGSDIQQEVARKLDSLSGKGAAVDARAIAQDIRPGHMVMTEDEIMNIVVQEAAARGMPVEIR